MYFVTKINNTLLRSERKIGRHGTALLVAFSLLILAAIYVRPALETVVLGNAYAELASDPFSENANAVGFRILTPCSVTLSA